MAGSFHHVMGPRGRWSLIENMGDAYECVEELLWLILRTMSVKEAERLLETEFYPMARDERPKDEAFLIVQQRMNPDDYDEAEEDEE